MPFLNMFFVFKHLLKINLMAEKGSTYVISIVNWL